MSNHISNNENHSINANAGNTDSGFASLIPETLNNNSGFDNSKESPYDSGNSNQYSGLIQTHIHSDTNQGMGYPGAKPLNNIQATNQNMSHNSISSTITQNGQSTKMSEANFNHSNFVGQSSHYTGGNFNNSNYTGGNFNDVSHNGQYSHMGAGNFNNSNHSGQFSRMGGGNFDGSLHNGQFSHMTGENFNDVSHNGQYSHMGGGNFNDHLTGQVSHMTGGKLAGVPGCKKCNGTGFKSSKKSTDKVKPCKSCLKSHKICSKCNGTGLKLKDGKACKCK